MGMHVGGAGEDGPITDINVTPLVDVSLVLVIIFMVTTPFMTQSKLKVTLPKAVTDESKNEEYVTLTIDKENKISVDEKNVTNEKELEQVAAIKLRGSKDNVVIVKADQDAEYGTVIDAMEVVKRAKPKKIYFATQHKTQGQE